nr:cytochrome p450 monooxygenase paxq [Quercus suber]
MHDLCSHPEYIELLREEIEASQAAIRMGKLISLRRKVLKTSVLADGTEVPADHWICVPQREVMNDPSLYPNAEHFDGSRFLKQRDTRARSEDEPGVRLTDVHPFYPFWGLGKETCQVTTAVAPRLRHSWGRLAPFPSLPYARSAVRHPALRVCRDEAAKQEVESDVSYSSAAGCPVSGPRLGMSACGNNSRGGRFLGS